MKLLEIEKSHIDMNNKKMVQVAKWPSPVKDKPKKDVYKLSRI
jgi:hypothetical protein